MTKEQAIERCHQLLKTKHSSWLGLSNQQAIAILIDMLKEKDEKIEYYRRQKDYDMQFRHELLEKIRCLNLDKDEKDTEIEKYKNMIIEHKKQLRQSGIYGYDYDLKID